MSKLHLTKSCILTIFLLATAILAGQDIEQVVKAPPVTTNGGVSISQIANFTSDTVSHPSPYSYYLSGNLNTNLFGVVSLPLSFAYTNNQVTSSLPQPFNRLSLSPSYKWVTAHIGYSAMNFSPYTLAGHEFMGGGVELSPDKPFKILAMYGRLKKAVNPDTIGSEPHYRRMGGGVMVNYMHEKIDASFNIFKAKDDIHSIHFYGTDSLFIKPQDNITGSAAINFKLINNFNIMAEYAMSMLNHDISDKDSIIGNESSGFFIQRQGDLAYYYAFKTSLSQTTKVGRIGATYERVSPNYKTLGAYYFNNDFENITANFSTSIKDRVNIAMDGGYQKDNLEDQKTNQSLQFIYSGNISAQLTKKLNLGLALSNVQTHVHIKDIYDEVTETNEFQNIDTLNFTQLNLTASGNINYVLQATKDKRQNLNASFMYQEASEIQQDDERFTGSKIYNSTVSYMFSLIPRRFTLSTTINHNHNHMPDMLLNVVSLNLSLQKALFEKIKTSLVTTYSTSTAEQQNVANILNVRLSAGYTLQKRHNFNLSLAMVNNQGTQGATTNYSVNLAYSYMFNAQIKRDKEKLSFSGSF